MTQAKDYHLWSCEKCEVQFFSASSIAHSVSVFLTNRDTPKSCATLQYPKIRLHFKLYPIFEPQPSADKAITYESALNKYFIQ